MDRRRFLKYAGATAAVAGTSVFGLDYYLRTSVPELRQTTQASISTSTPIQTPLTSLAVSTPPNPVVEYAQALHLPDEFMDRLSFLGAEGTLSTEVQDFLDILGYLESNRDAMSSQFWDCMVDLRGYRPERLNASKLENRLIEFVLADSHRSSEEGKFVGYLKRNPSDIQYGLINNSLDQSLVGTISRLSDSGASPDLVYEMSRLPDARITSDTYPQYLEKFSELSRDPELAQAFRRMLNEGVRAGRRECTGLEALLWILTSDGEERAVKTLRDTGGGVGLVQRAWKSTSASRNYTSDRWRDFDEVTSRLTCPELVRSYMRDNIVYRRDVGNTWSHPEYTFSRKFGDCEDHAALATYSLNKNGYYALVLCVSPEKPVGHAVCFYMVDDSYYVLDNIPRPGTLYGPYPRLLAAAEGTRKRAGLSRDYTIRTCNAYGWPLA